MPGYQHVICQISSLLIAVVPSIAFARQWHVAPDGTGEAPTIQAAVDSAQSGDEIVIAAGRYTWTSQRGSGESMIEITKSGLSLRGEAGAGVTVLDAERQGRVIRCLDARDVHIEGLTITNGLTRTGSLQGDGGGIYATSGATNLSVARCTVRDNIVSFSSLGGGIACQGGGAQIDGCQIAGNTAAYDAVAGGVALVDGVLSNSTIENNFNGGSGSANAGGVLAIRSHVLRCVIVGNRCSSAFGSSGGGVVAEGGSISDCLIADNVVETVAYGGSRGGGISCSRGTNVSRCIILHNSARGTGLPGMGAGIAGYDGNTIVGCTVYRNVAVILDPGVTVTPVGGINLPDGGSVNATIVARNEGGACGGTAMVSCSDIYGNSQGDVPCGIDGGGNFSADPLFCSPDPASTRNVTIGENSPCAPSGALGCGLIGAGDVACVAVQIRQATWGDVKELYR